MKFTFKTTSTIGVLIWFVLWLATVVASGYGYIHNIILLISHTGAFGILELIRAIGILAAPLGVIMGYTG